MQHILEDAKTDWNDYVGTAAMDLEGEPESEEMLAKQCGYDHRRFFPVAISLYITVDRLDKVSFDINVHAVDTDELPADPDDNGYPWRIKELANDKLGDLPTELFTGTLTPAQFRCVRRRFEVVLRRKYLKGYSISWST